jgi:integrase/recombinase XerD
MAIRRKPNHTKPIGQSDFLELPELSSLIATPNRKTLAGLRDATFLLLIANTGARRAEIIALDIGNIDFDRCLVAMSRKKKRKGQKEKIELPLDDFTVASLREYIQQWHIQPTAATPLFQTLGKSWPKTKDRMTPKAVDLLIRKYTRIAGIKKRISSHSFRATKLTLSLDQGASLADLRALAGHENVETTSRYLRSNLERLKKIQQKPLVRF